jgi:hypothetical protein
MTSILIDGSYLGMPQHVAVDRSGTCSLLSDPDDAVWKWSDVCAHNSLRHLALGTGTAVANQPPTSHAKSWEALGVTPPWVHALPPHVFKKWLQRFSADLLDLCDKWADSYYGREYQVQQRLLQKLRQPVVSDDLIKTAGDEKLSHFMSEDGRHAPKSVYDIWSSTTGRMSICSGPNILTLDRQHRKIFKSRYTGGVILQIDFTSLEPCTALAMQGKAFDGDAYTWAAGKVDVEAPRDVLKVAVMSALYGMSPSNFAKKFENIPHANDLLFQVRDAFGVDRMTKQLREQLDAVGHITNYYGRVIKCDKKSPLVSYSVQSTAVDVVCQGFTALLEEFERDKWDVTPLYLIHDALMIDVSPSHIESLRGRVAAGVWIPTMSCTMPLKLKTIDA